MVGLCEALVREGGERVAMLVDDDAAREDASARLRHLGDDVALHAIRYGDVWLRDTTPVFVLQDGALGAPCFTFNGWGNKYLYPNDAELGARLAQTLGCAPERIALVAEGGALECDGDGTCLTTRSCLLGDNRNPAMSEQTASAILCEALGLQRVLWLDDGLRFDHTDGHIDNVARFVRPGVVVCGRPSGDDDPQAQPLLDVQRQLRGMRDAHERTLDVIEVPAPGYVKGPDGDPLPASHLNFYVANQAVLVPAFGGPSDEAALAVIAELFPERRAHLVSARALLEGGGTLHCVSCHQPRVR